MAARKRTRSQSSEAPGGPSTSSQTDSVPDHISITSHRSKHEPPKFGMEDFERPSADEPHGKKRKTTIRQGTDREKIDGESKLSKVKQRLKTTTRQKNMMVFEGVGDQKSDLNRSYTQVFITARGSDAPRAEHESRQLRSQSTHQSSNDFEIGLNDIFRCLPGQEKQPRTVLTQGVAGIGKSFTVQKFTLDWASEESNLDVDFILTFPFRELNLCRDDKSFHKLATLFHPDLLDLTSSADYVNAKTVVILDGLDESRLHLAFQGNERVTSVDQKTSMANLIVNLIKGDLLPDANLWITSRPTAADQIPAENVGLMTEIRGFSDPQIEEYFKRRFSPNLDLAKRITSHIQSSPSLSHMCQIPIFCWISALLFQEVFEGEKPNVPQTLTEMMAHFLFAQISSRKTKYSETPAKEIFLTKHKTFLLSLGKLAFEQLLKNNLIFYEKDFEECGIDMREALVCSGFCNTVLLEEELLYQRKVFFFVHLTVQEFFAALYIYDSFTNNRITELGQFLQLKDNQPTLLDLLKMTVDKVLAKENGHMDFFMQFLLGLLVEPNRRVLGGLLEPPDSSQDAEKKVLTHLKSIRRKTVSPDGCINLFQTMVEMRDHKVKDEIEEYLRERDHSGTELTPLHCSALAYSLQVSKSDMELLDLKRYNTSEEGRRRLIPAVRRSRKALLSYCRVTVQWVEHLAFGLKFPHSPLQDLDLSNNDLGDSGVQALSNGLSSQYCRVETLRLSGCMVTENGCSSLVSALRSNPSHLKVLDLSYNHLGESGKHQLEELRSDPQFKLTDLKYDHDGPQRMKPGFKKYAFDGTLDPDTVNRKLLLLLSEGVTWVDQQQVNTGRSEICLPQRCYLELDLLEPCSVVLAYESVSGKQSEGLFGREGKSWSFILAGGHCYVEHGGGREEVVSPFRHSRRIAVYLDRQAGLLSFYRVSSDSLTCLHTFTETFSEDLRPAVGLQPHASVTSCPPK